MMEKFGWNGVPLDRVSEPILEKELSKNRDAELAVPCLLAVMGSILSIIVINNVIEDQGALMFGSMLLGLFAMSSVCAASVGFIVKAQEQNKIPSRSNSASPASHVSGLGAAVILGIGACLAAAAYFGQASNGHIRIPEWLGLSVILLFCAIFFWIFLISKVFDFSSLRGGQRILERLFRPLVPIGKKFSQFDAYLVFVFAPIFGATLQGSYLRYGVLFSHLIGGTMFAWLGPPPIGLFGAIWAVTGIIALSRRWSWIETERNRILQDPSIPSTDLRISIDDDLRDEAVLGLLALVVVLPIAMRQIHLWLPAVPIFAVEPASVNRLDAWVGFFGVELLKALPFLDWADVYDAQAVTRIESVSALSMHLVLISRAILDLLFISAIFQSIAISVSLAKNRSDFLNKRPGVDQLDPRIEVRELSGLAYKSKGQWVFRREIVDFTHYNLRRLSFLRLRAPEGGRLRSAIDKILALSNREVVPPAEQLVDITARKKISPKELGFALSEVEDSQNFDLELFAIARRQLNRKGGMENERKKIVQWIVSKLPNDPARERELARILYGRDADSLANIRVLVVGSLARNTRIYPRNRLILSAALASDRSKSVRQVIEREMNRYGISPIRNADIGQLLGEEFVVA